MTVRFPPSSPLDVMARAPMCGCTKAVRITLVSRRCHARKRCLEMSNFCRCSSPVARHSAPVTKKCFVSSAGMEWGSPAALSFYREGTPAPVQHSTLYTMHTCVLYTVHCVQRSRCSGPLGGPGITSTLEALYTEH